MTEQFYPAAPAQAPVEPEKKSGLAGKIVIGVLAVLVVLGAAGFGLYKFMGSQTVQAKTGDCITQHDDPNAIKVVACDQADAKFQVYGVIETATQDEGKQGCTQYPEANQFLFLYEGDLVDNTTGRVLCLGPVAVS